LIGNYPSSLYLFFDNRFGSLAMFAAILLASSMVSTLAMSASAFG